MKTLLTLFKTNDSFTPLIARLILGLVMFPHGAQKALGWFGGYGFSATINFFTGQLHIPVVLAFLAIAAEFAGSIGLITGFFSRVAASGIAAVMLVATLTVHASNGFFMNWAGNQKGEGFEYHLLALGLALVVILSGAGKWSIDRLLAGKLGLKGAQQNEHSDKRAATLTAENVSMDSRPAGSRGTPRAAAHLKQSSIQPTAA